MCLTLQKSVDYLLVIGVQMFGMYVVIRQNSDFFLSMNLMKSFIYAVVNKPSGGVYIYR